MRFAQLWQKSIKGYPNHVAGGSDHLTINALLLVLILAIMGTTGLGSYLDNYLFYQPIMQLRMKLGRQPKLTEAIRIILVDDRSLEKLGRTPSLAEWLQIGAMLRASGYQIGLFQGFIDLERDIGVLDSLPTDKLLPLYAGAVGNVDSHNIRALNVASLPEPFSALCPTPPAEASRLKFSGLQTMSTKAFPFLTGLGDIALVSNHKLPAGLFFSLPNLASNNRSESLRFIPPLGALVTAPHPDSCLGQGLVSADGSIYTDFVKVEEALQASLPVTVFFDKSYKNIVSQPSEKLSAKLAGGTVAIFVPEAYTGSRFIDSPHGKLPSYLTTVSLANSILSQRILLLPFHPMIGLSIGLAFIWGLSFLLTFRNFTIVSVTLIAGGYLCSGAALVFFDTLIPPATAALSMALLCLVRSADHFLATVTTKTRLEKDLELGRTVQNLFTPTTMAGAMGHWHYSFVYQPFGAMSGDWLQVFQPEDDCQTPAIIAIGDVVGKGASAALITAVIASLWSKLKFQKQSINVDSIEHHVNDFLNTMNTAIAETFKGQQNSTISLAAVMQNHALLTSCGAPFWILWQADGTVTSLRTTPQNPLGRASHHSDTPYSFRSLTMTAGDVLIAYSDGVLDGSQARSKFIKSLQSQSMPQTASTLQNFIASAARKAGEGFTLPDDFTLLILQYNPFCPLEKSSTIATPLAAVTKAE